MKKLLILLLITCTLHLHAQDKKHNYTRDIIGYGMMFAGGMMDGFNQVQRHHYYIFAEKHPDHNPLFWGPDQWKNKWALDPENNLIPVDDPAWYQPKYKERFWGSSRWFVGVTDAHHLTRLLDVSLTLGGTLTINIHEKRPHWHYLAQFAGMMLARSTGFVLIHDVIYK